MENKRNHEKAQKKPGRHPHEGTISPVANALFVCKPQQVSQFKVTLT